LHAFERSFLLPPFYKSWCFNFVSIQRLLSLTKFIKKILLTTTIP
jgi:hypothetical protein